MQVEVTGFTPNQKVLADVIWAMDSQDAVQRFIDTLGTEQLRHDARVARDMLTAAVLDQQMDVDPAITKIIDKFRI